MIVPMLFGMMWRTTMRVAAAAHHPHRLYVLPHPERQRLPPDESCGDQPRDEGDDEDEDDEGRAEDRRQDDGQEEHRDRQEGVDDPHQEGVDPGAEEARDRPVEGAEDRGDGGRCESDEQRHLPPVHQATEDVEAARVGAERMSVARRRIVR